ncbi:MAG: MtnX-like HAD-IB family phosphatase [Oscillospiraceae bacterium]|nr:MtnX-like HAD-IB family phosphatase [Oscillospiraceae bacterium]
MKQLNEKKYVLVSDFDGTITLEDSNALLFQVCGNAENAQIEVDFIAGALSNREAMERHFDVMRITRREYDAFLDANIHIDPGFDAFLQQTKRYEVPLFIVSAGFRQGIERVLGAARLQGVEVFANDLLGGDHLKPVFATERPDCEKPVGPCGNCKRACLAAIQKRTGQPIVYIGDGLTDRCAMEAADLLFAKDALAAYCDVQGLAYTPFESFTDITNCLWTERSYN